MAYGLSRFCLVLVFLNLNLALASEPGQFLLPKPKSVQALARSFVLSANTPVQLRGATSIEDQFTAELLTSEIIPKAAATGGADVLMRMKIAPHPYFRREGNDVFLDVPVSLEEAVLGAKVDVPALHGPARMRIPPGAASGQCLRLSGRGVPATTPGGEPGDLLVELQIVLPPVRDERSKELLREFARLNDVDVRAHLHLMNGR